MGLEHDGEDLGELPDGYVSEILYHATSARNVESIRKNRFYPAGGARLRLGPGIYFSNSPESAYYRSSHYRNSWSSYLMNTAIIKCRVTYLKDCCEVECSSPWKSLTKEVHIRKSLCGDNVVVVTSYAYEQSQIEIVSVRYHCNGLVMFLAWLSVFVGLFAPLVLVQDVPASEKHPYRGRAWNFAPADKLSNLFIVFMLATSFAMYEHKMLWLMLTDWQNWQFSSKMKSTGEAPLTCGFCGFLFLNLMHIMVESLKPALGNTAESTS